jgi:hypothetical protein
VKRQKRQEDREAEAGGALMPADTDAKNTVTNSSSSSSYRPTKRARYISPASSDDEGCTVTKATTHPDLVSILAAAFLNNRVELTANPYEPTPLKQHQHQHQQLPQQLYVETKCCVARYLPNTVDGSNCFTPTNPLMDSAIDEFMLQEDDDQVDDDQVDDELASFDLEPMPFSFDVGSSFMV